MEVITDTLKAIKAIGYTQNSIANFIQKNDLSAREEKDWVFTSNYLKELPSLYFSNDFLTEEGRQCILHWLKNEYSKTYFDNKRGTVIAKDTWDAILTVARWMEIRRGYISLKNEYSLENLANKVIKYKEKLPGIVRGDNLDALKSEIESFGKDASDKDLLELAVDEIGKSKAVPRKILSHIATEVSSLGMVGTFLKAGNADAAFEVGLGLAIAVKHGWSRADASVFDAMCKGFDRHSPENSKRFQKGLQMVNHAEEYISDYTKEIESPKTSLRRVAEILEKCGEFRLFDHLPSDKARKAQGLLAKAIKTRIPEIVEKDLNGAFLKKMRAGMSSLLEKEELETYNSSIAKACGKKHVPRNVFERMVANMDSFEPLNPLLRTFLEARNAKAAIALLDEFAIRHQRELKEENYEVFAQGTEETARLFYDYAAIQRGSKEPWDALAEMLIWLGKAGDLCLEKIIKKKGEAADPKDRAIGILAGEIKRSVETKRNLLKKETAGLRELTPRQRIGQREKEWSKLFGQESWFKGNVRGIFFNTLNHFISNGYNEKDASEMALRVAREIAFKKDSNGEIISDNQWMPPSLEEKSLDRKEEVNQIREELFQQKVKEATRRTKILAKISIEEETLSALESFANSPETEASAKKRSEFNAQDEFYAEVGAAELEAKKTRQSRGIFQPRLSER